jgi:hypothetical protein
VKQFDMPAGRVRFMTEYRLSNSPWIRGLFKLCGKRMVKHDMKERTDVWQNSSVRPREPECAAARFEWAGCVPWTLRTAIQIRVHPVKYSARRIVSVSTKRRTGLAGAFQKRHTS